MAAELTVKEAILSRIYDSHGWKALSAYYEIRNKLLPEGTWQRAFAKRLFHNVLSLKRTFSQQGQFSSGVGATREENKEEVTEQIVQETGPTVQQGQFGSGVVATREENKEEVTEQIVQETGPTVQELMTPSFESKESDWQDYEYLADQISCSLRQAQLKRLSLKRPELISIDEKALLTYAKPLVLRLAIKCRYRL